MCFAPGLVKHTLSPSGIRTRDLPITSRMLYQLTYRPLDCQIAEIFLSTQLTMKTRENICIDRVVNAENGQLHPNDWKRHGDDGWDIEQDCDENQIHELTEHLNETLLKGKIRFQPVVNPIPPVLFCPL